MKEAIMSGNIDKAIQHLERGARRQTEVSAPGTKAIGKQVTADEVKRIRNAGDSADGDTSWVPEEAKPLYAPADDSFMYAVNRIYADDSSPRYLPTAEDILAAGQKNTATEAGRKRAGAIKQLKKNIESIKTMPELVELTGNEVPKEGRMTDRALQFINSIGGKVNRKGFGDVLFSKAKIKASYVGHGGSGAKIDLIAAVPSVIQNGKQIGYARNYENRGYDSYLFAGPVNYKGEKIHVVVIVDKDKQSNRYYLHEAMDENGNLILGEKESPSTASDRPILSDTDTVADTEPSTVNLPQQTQTVNQNLSTNAAVDKNGNDLTTREGAAAAMAQRKQAEAEKRNNAGNYQNTAPAGTAMDKLGIRIAGDQGDYFNAGSLREQENARKKADRDVKKLEKKLSASDTVKSFAKDIVRGKYTIDNVPADMRMDVGMLAAAYEAQRKAHATEGVERQRRAINRENEQQVADIFRDVDDTQVKEKSMVVQNEMTPQRLLTAMFGKQKGEEIINWMVKPAQENEAELGRFMRRELDSMRTFTDSSGKQSKLTDAENEILQVLIDDGQVIFRVGGISTVSAECIALFSRFV